MTEVELYLDAVSKRHPNTFGDLDISDSTLTLILFDDLPRLVELIRNMHSALSTIADLADAEDSEASNLATAMILSCDDLAADGDRSNITNRNRRL